MTMTQDRYPQREEGERRISAWLQECRDKGYTFDQRIAIEQEAEAKGNCRDCVHHKAETTSGRCQPCQDERDDYYEQRIYQEHQDDWDE